jgi:hypothetical protein
MVGIVKVAAIYHGLEPRLRAHGDEALGEGTLAKVAALPGAHVDAGRHRQLDQLMPDPQPLGQGHGVRDLLADKVRHDGCQGQHATAQRLLGSREHESAVNSPGKGYGDRLCLPQPLQ